MNTPEVRFTSFLLLKYPLDICNHMTPKTLKQHFAPSFYIYDYFFYIVAFTSWQ